MVSRILYLEPGQLRRAWPFFALYLMLFAGLTLADGLALTLVVARIGAGELPRLQALSAACVMVSVGWYLRAAPRRGADQVFVGLLVGPALLFAFLWLGLTCNVLNARWLGLLFLGRELVFTLTLLHFGAFLQDYFTRAELNRVMPAIYAGGRVGGIAGGVALEHLSRLVPPVHLLPAVAVLLALGIVGVKLIHRFTSPVDEPGGPAVGDAPSLALSARESAGVNASRPETFVGLLALVWRSPLLFWITVSTTALFVCRAGLVFQCGAAFERAFASDAEMAAFLGRYAQFALAVCLAFQVLVVGRLVAWIGLRGAQLVYAAFLAAAAVGGWGEMTLAAAVFARFVEGELRYGLRNPVAQMTVNLFDKRIRTQVRAWSLGLVIPAATMAASLGLDLLTRHGAYSWVAVSTIAAAAGYLAASLGLAANIAPPQDQEVAKQGSLNQQTEQSDLRSDRRAA